MINLNEKRIEQYLNSKWSIVFILIILANLIVRFLALPSEGIYGDEPFTIFFAQQPLEDLYQKLMYDRNPPLYFFMLHYWIKLFGIESMYLKALSVLFTCGTAAGILLIAGRYFTKQIAVIASLLFLLSNVQLLYSHELRAFALSGMLISFSFFFYLNTLKRPTKSSLIALAFMNVAMLFAHYINVFVPLVQFIGSIFFFKQYRKGFWHYIISQVIAFILYLPWVKIVLENIPEAGEFWLQTPGIKELKYVFISLSGNTFQFTLHTILIFAFILLLITDRRKRFIEDKFNLVLFILLLLWYALPVLADYGLAQFTPVFRLPYLVYSSIGLFILLAYVIFSIKTTYWIKLGLVILLLYQPVKNFTAFPRESEIWSEVVPKVAKLKNDNTAVMISAWYKHRAFAYYYNRAYFKDYENILTHLTNENIFCINNSNAFNELDYSWAHQVIFVKSHQKVVDPDKTIDKHIVNSGYKLCDEFGEMDVNVAVYRKNGRNCDSLLPVTYKNENLSPCSDWIKTTLYDGVSNDTVYHYLNDMEFDSICQIPANISDQQSFSGQYACLVNQKDEYSTTFKTVLNSDSKISRLKISFAAYHENALQARMVISLEHKGNNIFREDIFLKEVMAINDKWHTFSKILHLPKIKKENVELKVYLWNPGKENVFLDDFEVELR
jgi:hypothetical protein